ncbi:MAG: hypothetical protein HS117_08045 [Verrucomicrobiaceae bacterium]|nr:hypothetical protein [Verrucomicrobiaceae bacterium]
MRLTTPFTSIALAITSFTTLQAAGIPGVKAAPAAIKAPSVPKAPVVHVPVVPKVPAVKLPAAPKVPVVAKTPVVKTPAIPKIPATSKVPAVKAPVVPKIVSAPKVPAVKAPATPKIPVFSAQARISSAPKLPQISKTRIPAAAPASIVRPTVKHAALGNKMQTSRPLHAEKKDLITRRVGEFRIEKKAQHPVNTNGGALVAPPPANGTPDSPLPASSTDPANRAGELGWTPWWAAGATGR